MFMVIKKPLLAGLAAAALAFHLFAGGSFIKSAAPTFDEPVHLVTGYVYLTSGRFMMDLVGHPPLSEALSALPLLFFKLSSFASHPFSINGETYSYADLFLYNNHAAPERLLNTARWGTFALWTALSALFLYIFAVRLSGQAAAVFSIIAFCFTPAFISNNALVTTDAAAAVFYLGAVAAAYRCARFKPSAGRAATRPGDLWAAAAGALSGLAMASKFSMFIVPPVIIGLWLLDAFLNRSVKPARTLWYSCIFLAAAALALSFVCRGEPGVYFTNLFETLGRISNGHSSFAWGRYSVTGVWWYFPLAFAVKTPLALVFLAAAGVLAFFRRPGRDWLWLLVPPGIYFAAALGSAVQIGYRHILPVMLFVALAAGLGAEYIISRRKWPLMLTAAALVLLWGGLMYRTHPYYLAYFNELAGGPGNGYKLLVDSNLDWGQDVKTLAGYLQTRNNPPIILSYFGVAKPESYGISYVPLGNYFKQLQRKTGVQACGLKEVLLAVSATNLQGVYYADKESFAWLKSRKPVFTAGYSIFLYDLTADMDGISRLAALLDREGRNSEAECLYARLTAAPR